MEPCIHEKVGAVVEPLPFSSNQWGTISLTLSSGSGPNWHRNGLDFGGWRSGAIYGAMHP